MPKHYLKKPTTSFHQKVYEVVSKIPPGKVLTYKEVAMLSGSPNAARAVGSALKKNYNPSIPCHRVIKSSGKLGNYNRGASLKRALLKEEGFL